VHIIYSILLFSYFFLLGRGLIILINKFSNKRLNLDNFILFDTSIIIFYPLIGLIYFSNLMFIFNFFFPLKFSILIYIISTPLILNAAERIKFKNYKKIYLFSILNLIIISVSSYDINFQYDSGYYHLNYQNWLRESKLVFGLNNLHGAYGTSSIIDYLSAPLWLGSNLILLHYLTIAFLAVFLNFILYHIVLRENKFFFLSSLYIIIFCLLDNFGLNGGRNGFFTIPGIIKPDIASGVLFFLSTTFLTSILYKKNSKKIEFIFLNILIIYAYQLKISTALLFFFFAYVLIKNKKLKIKELVLTNLILLFWIIKSIALTSCIVYPVELTCLNLPWYNINSITGVKNVTGDFNNSYFLGTSLIDWFNDWILIELNQSITINFLTSFFIIYVLNRVITKKTNVKAVTLYIPLIFIFFNLFIWIIGAPHPRFIYGLFAYIIALLAFKSYSPNLELKINKNHQLIIFSLCLASISLIPRINSYKALFDNPFGKPEIVAPQIEYINLKSNWVLPKNGDQCWININCVPDNINITNLRYLTFDTYIVEK